MQPGAVDLPWSTPPLSLDFDVHIGNRSIVNTCLITQVCIALKYPNTRRIQISETAHVVRRCTFIPSHFVPDCLGTGLPGANLRTIYCTGISVCILSIKQRIFHMLNHASSEDPYDSHFFLRAGQSCVQRLCMVAATYLLARLLFSAKSRRPAQRRSLQHLSLKRESDHQQMLLVRSYNVK